MDQLRRDRIRESTRRNYYQIWKSFNQFFTKLDVKPTTWEDRITLFVAYLVDKNRKSMTIRCYILAIKAVLQDNLIEVDENRYLLSSLTRACRIHRDVVKTRLPIGKEMLHVLLQHIEDRLLVLNQAYLAQLYTTIVATAYYGLLRIGEVSSGSHPVLVDDVHIGINKNKFLFILRSSKMHSKGYQRIKISRMVSRNQCSAKKRRNEKWCPFRLLSTYLTL